MGQKWQCVEFARRFLYVNQGWVFDDVGLAYEIFELSTIRDVRNGRRLPLRSFRNGSLRPPEPGCLLVWDEGGEFARTGHVAVVVEVSDRYVRFAEQNLDHCIWPEGRVYSREIKATRGEAGEFWVESSFADATILGWVIQTDDDTDAVEPESPDAVLRTIIAREVPPELRDDARAWLNLANADEAAYVEMNGHLLSDKPLSRHRYLSISETIHAELEKATNQLHALFMHATDYVLEDDALLSRFRLPQALWPRIHRSWDNRRNQMITGRFDFALTAGGLKAYEYNCDSAACYMECGKIQGKWAQHYQCEVGDDPGAKLHERLRDAWARSGVDGVVHILHDDDPEETYHALFMQEAMERGGVRSRIIRGISGLVWGERGQILDDAGIPIRYVWKTWAWETALDQLRRECEDDEERLRTCEIGRPHDGAVRLMDVLLGPEVIVFEPLWTLIPSNKAILPILWSLFPDHPYLLETTFELTPELERRGHVVKPIVGRCGSNVSIVDGSRSIVERTAGRFDDRDRIFQQLFPLPKIDGLYAQLSTFSVAGVYAASAIRVDESLVITEKSDNVALRVMDDERFLDLSRWG